MKFKKTLVIIITILLCFTMFQKPKKTEAFDFVVTPAVLWVLGTLAVGTGVVLVNKEQVMDLGGKIADTITDWSQIIEDGKMKLNSFLFEKIIDVVVSLVANETVELAKFGTKTMVINGFVLNDTNALNSPRAFENAFSNRFSQIIKFDVDITKVNSISVNGFVWNLPIGADYVLIGQQYNMFYETSTPYVVHMFIPKSSTSINSSSFSSYNAQAIKKSDTLITSLDLDIAGAGYKDITTFPYGESTFKENFNPFPTQALPFNGTQAIPIPQDVPLVGDITTEFPLTNDNLFEKGGIQVIPNDNVLDHEGTIDDVPGTDIPEGLSLWGWLKALLMALLNLIKGIFDIIKKILSFITNFFANLIKALLGFITSLFTVSDTYFVDMFNGFKDRFSSKLNYNSYLDFLDYGYSPNAIKDITVNWFGQQIVIVKLSLFEHFRSAFNTFVYGIMFFLLAMYNYNQVYKLIRSVDLTNPSSPSQFQIDLQASRKNKNLGG